MADAYESHGSTIPDSFSYDGDQRGLGGPDGDFARLLPVSPLARTAFNDIAHQIHTQPHSFAHARRFIHYAPLHADEGGENSPDGSLADSIARNEYCGYYRLNLDILPKNIGLGWVAGSSRRNLLDDEVDLVLTPQPGQHKVRGRHVRFSHNTNTGVLMVYADNWAVLIDGKKRIQNTAFAACEDTGLMLGDLSYTIEFTGLDPQIYQKQLNDIYRQCQSNFSSIPHFLPPTPTPSLRASGYYKYFVYPTTAGGTYSTVSRVCNKDTGELFILKKMKRNSHNLAAIAAEVDILKRLNHYNVCQLVDTLQYERTHSFRHEEYDDVGLILTPFAPSLSLNVPHHQPASWVVNISRQCFAGLAYVHRQGLMHRDIKLSNIGLVVNNTSGQPPRIILLDFGHATRNLTSTDHMKGTVRYLAPEVMALKRNAAKYLNPYTNKVDIWALGICIYELFYESLIHWSCVDDESSDEGWIRGKIGLIRSEEKDNYVLRLVMGATIVWNPLIRSSADDVLALFGGETVVVEGKVGIAATAAKRRHFD
ncbi:hypothetical protein LTR66_003329 [Elasticomyces elasticus]|nr:hypothetical protein LTR66_003329 [Elasticomyces elasticus]